MKSSRKIVLISLVIAVLLFFLTIALLPRLLKLEQVRAGIEEKASEVLGHEVTISGARLSLLTGPRIIFENISVANGDGFGSEPVIQAASLHMSAGLEKIFEGIIEIEEISLIRPSIRLVRNPTGTWNFEDSLHPIVGGLLSMGPNEQASFKEKAGSFTATLGADEISFHQGKVILVDQSGEVLDRDLTIAGIDGRLQLPGSADSIKIAASFEPFEESSRVIVEASAGPMDGTGDLNKTPVNIRIEAPGVKMSQVPVPIKGIPLILTGLILSEQSISGTIQEGFHFRQNLTFSKIKVETAEGFSIIDQISGTLSQTGRLQAENRSVHLDTFDLSVGSSQFSATGTARHNGLLPHLTMNFQSNSPDLGRLLEHFPDIERRLNVKGGISIKGSLKGVPGNDLAASIDIESDHMEADRGPALLEEHKGSPGPSDADQAFEDLLPPSLPLTVSAKLSLLEGRFEWVTFSNLTADIRLKNRWVSMDRMQFNAFGGMVEGSTWFNMRRLPATYGNDIKIREMQIDQFLTSFAGLEGIMSGIASLDLFVSGRGKNMEQFKENTTGLGRFQISSGRYTPANFLKEALHAASLDTESISPEETEFESMDSNIAVKGGKIDFTNLDCISEGWNLEGSGIIGMDQSLSLRYRMTLSDSTASAIGADNLKTLPRDKKGNHQIPFRLSGTFISPVFSLIQEETGKSAGK